MDQKKKNCVVVMGTRPEAIKLAPLVLELQEHPDLRPTVVLSAQHREMLDQVLDIFSIQADFDLNIMRPNQTLTDVTTSVIGGMSKIFEEIKPDMVFVQGDTTTAFCSGLAAFYQKCPVGHIEAGLRTGEKFSPYPEEVNRKLVSQLADVHFAPTEMTRDNLLREGMDPASIAVTGNTVVDAVRIISAKDESEVGLPQEISAFLNKFAKPILMTAHRRESFGDPMKDMFWAVLDIVEADPEAAVIYPVHPNPNVQSLAREMLGEHPNILLSPPLQYDQFVAIMKRSYLILTDSGGMQEEAPGLDKPVIVMRDHTERQEAIDAGVAQLVGTDRQRIVTAATDLLKSKADYQKIAETDNPYGDGYACAKILARTRDFLFS
jgi:UDP-N-acetylglucosamine 2-epimerase (non-hydrolysing)